MGPDLVARYLKAKKMKPAHLAAAAGIARGTLSNLLSGKTGCGLAVALKIERATRGAVPVKAWGDPAIRKAS